MRLLLSAILLLNALAVAAFDSSRLLEGDLVFVVSDDANNPITRATVHDSTPLAIDHVAIAHRAPSGEWQVVEAVPRRGVVAARSRPDGRRGLGPRRGAGVGAHGGPDRRECGEEDRGGDGESHETLDERGARAPAAGCRGAREEAVPEGFARHSRASYHKPSDAARTVAIPPGFW